MKKLALIIMVLATVLTGCSSPLSGIEATSLDIVSITPNGMNDLSATIELGIKNPAFSFTVSEMRGCLKMDGQKCVDMEADQLKVEGRTEKKYLIPVRAKFSKGFKPILLLGLIQNSDLKRFTLDISANVGLRSGSGKTFEFKDVPLEKLIRK